MDLFGRSGIRVWKVLNKLSAEELEKTSKSLRRFGFFNAETAKQAEEAKDALTILHASIAGLKNEIGIRLFPVIMKITNAIDKWFERNEKIIKQRLDQVFRNIIPIAKALGAAIIALGGTAVVHTIIATIKLVNALGFAFFATWGKALFGPALLAAAIFIVVAALDELFTFMAGGDSLLGDWLGSFEDFKVKVKDIWEDIKDIFRTAIESIKAMFSLDLDRALDAQIEALEKLGKTAEKVFETFGGGKGRALGSLGQFGSFAGLGGPGASIISPAAALPRAAAVAGAGGAQINITGGPMTVQTMPGTTAGQAHDVGLAVERAQSKAMRDAANEIKRRNPR
jgi:hypothetical protein